MKFFLFTLSFFTALTWAQYPPVDTIIDRMENAEQVEHSISIMEQKVLTSSGNERTFRIKGYGIGNGEKGLSVYLSPARVKGEKILSLNEGDDIWTYSPKTRRARHLATHMKKAKVMGSDFSYEDMSGGDMKEKYTFKVLGEDTREGVKCLKLEMIPTDKGPDYVKILAWVNPETWMTHWLEYYNENGLLKTMTLSDFRTTDGHLSPWKITMKNHQEGGQTIMNTIEIDYNTKPEEWMFSVEGLKSQ
jgi:outer membrane lipoprotein-sorting protein